MRPTARVLLRAAVLLAACRLFAAPAGAETALERARSSAAIGDTAGALSAALAGLEAAPADRALFLYAVEVLPERPSKEAGRLAAAAAARLEKKDSHYSLYLGLCKAMRVSDKHAEAVANCKKALESDPTAYPVYRELGLSYAAAGNPRKAAETLEQGVELSSSDFKAHYHLASVLEARGDGVRASASYAKSLALARKSGDPEAPRYRAMIKAGLKRAGQKKAAPAPRRPAAPQIAATPQQAAACLEKFRAEFLKDSLGSALEASDACLKLSPSDPELASERAPLLVRLGRYEDGVKEYERAAALYGPKSQMSAFCRVKAAETWLKLRDQGRALAQYRLALAANPQDLNALKGLAEVQESASDRSGALQTYGEILKSDPGNQRAKNRSEELKAALLTKEEMLAELQFRQAADAQKNALTPEDEKLFKAIKAAEIGGAVDYLKAKVPSARGLTVSKKGPDGVKLLLTGPGYKAYVFHATKDAVKLFEERGVGLREIFQLRDLAGSPVFDAAGKLTPEGEAVWRSGGETRKLWLLPGEPVQESPQAVAARETVARLEKDGFVEISEPEYLWLLKVTRCPEITLKSAPVSAMVHVFDGTRTRYMMVSAEKTLNACNSRLPTYISKYRNNDIADVESDHATAFFGTGGTKKRRFCEDGEVWMGGGTPNPCSTAGPAR